MKIACLKQQNIKTKEKTGKIIIRSKINKFVHVFIGFAIVVVVLINMNVALNDNSFAVFRSKFG